MNNKTLYLTSLTLLTALIGIISLLFFTRNKGLDIFNQNSLNQNVIDCGSNYECLLEEITRGNPAKVIITEKVESLALEEKSEVRVEPSDGRFKVTMTLLELKKIEQNRRLTKSIIGSLSETCPQIVNNLSKVELKSAYCIAETVEEARMLAIEGLSDDVISKYSCRGTLVDEIKRICINQNIPNFPPGIKKPAIYPYPIQESNIRISVEIDGFITKSEPDYLKGWDVAVKPNGLINDQYDYLFYEAQLNRLELPKEGWVVKYNDLTQWFNVNLKKLGLNIKETSQFKDYWMQELPEAPYYEIRLLEEVFLKENMDLKINPIPTTIIRRNFYFKPHMSKILIKEPNIITPERKGFTVVEWGGY